METKISQICLYQQYGAGSVESMQHSENTKPGKDIRSYKRRFWMLPLFSTLSMLCGMAFPQYASMADVNMCFYGVNADAINWTCLLFMVVYIILVFPVSWFMDRVGLRITIIIGSICNTLSYAVQFATHTPEGFAYVMVTSFFGSLSNVFVLAIPPCLAATWFPSHEISRACAMGVFGNQLGVAVGFIFSPLLISSDCSKLEVIAEGKRKVSIILLSVNAIILLLIIFTFQKEPDFPPSIAQAEKKDINESYLSSALSMAKNANFVMVFIMYGLVVGTYFAIATLLNSLVLRYFPNRVPITVFWPFKFDKFNTGLFSVSSKPVIGVSVVIGWMGFLLIVAGLVGSILAGYILDYTHKFKETCISICALSCLFYVVFSCVLTVNKLWLQFVTIGTFGFFLTSFLPVGFEYAIEVTYPESEITSASLLNSATMLFGIIITMTTSYALQEKGPIYGNAVLTVALLISVIISCFITKNYKRSKKNNEVVSTTAL